MNNEIAENEEPITANDLLEEIKPLLKDYFAGEIFLIDNSILYKLPNGQNFLIKAEEVV